MSTFWTILSNWSLQAYKYRFIPELLVSLILAKPLSVVIYNLLGPERLIVIPFLEISSVKFVSGFALALIATSFFRSVLIAFFFRRPLAVLREQMASRHIVCGKFMITLIRDVINGHNNLATKLQEANPQLSIADVGKNLEANGIVLPENLFPQLLASSASFFPVDLLGLWNTCWYPPEEIFETSPVYSEGLCPNKDWIKYFETLGTIYSSMLLRVRNRHRIFIVEDHKYAQIMDNQFFDNSDHWKQLLLNQKEWGIEKQVFVAETEFKSIIEDYEGFCKELVIFRRRFHKYGWVIGQREKKEKIVRLISTKDQFNEYREKYKKIEYAVHRIEASLRNESLVEITVNGSASGGKYTVQL